MSIRLPWYVSNHVMPRADSRDPLTIVAAVKKRIVNPLPIEMDYDAIAELGQFAREWMRNNLTPLPYAKKMQRVSLSSTAREVTEIKASCPRPQGCPGGEY
jgi:hypothetical protein